MDKNEIVKMLMLNEANYPNFYTHFTNELRKVQVDLWFTLFGQADTKLIQDAFVKALAVSDYPVKPADVTRILKAQEQAKLPATDELFDIAMKAGKEISDYYSPDNGWMDVYDWRGRVSGFEAAKAVYDKLPAILREWRHSPLDIVRWYLTNRGSEESYVRHDFKEVMGDRLSRREALGIGFNDEFCPEFDALLGCIKSIDAFAEKKRIGGGA